MDKQLTDQYLHGRDELVDALKKRGAALRARFGKLVGRVYADALPSEIDPNWPNEAKELHKEHVDLYWEISRRNSRRCVKQISRITQILNTEGSTSEVVRWFLARY